MSRARCRNKGFTIVEIILTIVIIGIIAGVSAKILVSGLDTYSFIVSRKDTTQNARVAMERLVSELTLLRSTDITGIFNEHFGFKDRDGVKTSFRRLSVKGSPNFLARGSDYLGGVLGLIDFDYFQADGSSTSFILNVRKINIELSIESVGGHGSITLRTEVFPRNFMYSGFSQL